MKKILIVTMLAMMTPIAFAGSLPLFAGPSQNSKIVGEVNSNNEANYTKIFKNNDGWIKVANTTNGQVSWVKAIPAQSNQAMNHAQVQHMLQQVQQQKNQAIQAQKSFMQNYELTMANLNQKEKQLTNYLTANNSPTNSSVNNAFTKRNQPQYQSVSISYSGNGQNGNAKVSKCWMGKDGKKHTKTFEVPVSQLNQAAGANTI